MEAGQQNTKNWLYFDILQLSHSTCIQRKFQTIKICTSKSKYNKPLNSTIMFGIQQ